MTDAQTQTLRDLIDADADLAGKSDAEVADALAAPTEPGRVPYREFQPALMQMPLWPKVRLFARLTAPPAGSGLDDATFQLVLGAATVAVDLLIYYQGDSIDTTLPRFQMAMGALAQAGLVTPEERAAILALADNRRSKAQAAGLPHVSASDVAAAYGRRP